MKTIRFDITRELRLVLRSSRVMFTLASNEPNMGAFTVEIDIACLAIYREGEKNEQIKRLQQYL